MKENKKQEKETKLTSEGQKAKKIKQTEYPNPLPSHHFRKPREEEGGPRKKKISFVQIGGGQMWGGTRFTFSGMDLEKTYCKRNKASLEKKEGNERRKQSEGKGKLSLTYTKNR